MLVGLPTVALAVILADLAGNSATRPFTRGVFVVFVLLEIHLPETLGGLANWLVDAALTLL